VTSLWPYDIKLSARDTQFFLTCNREKENFDLLPEHIQVTMPINDNLYTVHPVSAESQNAYINGIIPEGQLWE
jgi:hypothetical protein